MKYVMMVLWLGVAAALTAQTTSESDAKAFRPTADQANIYIARKTETFGALLGFKVLVDGQLVAELKGGTFAFAQVGPGPHKIEIQGGVNSASVDLKADGGKNYFYETGAKAHTALLQPEIGLVLLEPMGRLMISQSSLAHAP